MCVHAGGGSGVAADGGARAAADQAPHRGTPLSLLSSVSLVFSIFTHVEPTTTPCVTLIAPGFQLSESGSAYKHVFLGPNCLHNNYLDLGIII